MELKMKLSCKQIESICLGAVRIEETANGICFHRFTEKQEKLYVYVGQKAILYPL
jgi:hypothetical protein